MPSAPTTHVDPSLDNATLSPNCALAVAFDAFTYACCAHVAPTRVKMYAAPASRALLSASLPPMPVAALASLNAPTASVDPSPDKRRATPNRSPAPVLEAFTYACGVHVM